MGVNVLLNTAAFGTRLPGSDVFYRNRSWQSELLHPFHPLPLLPPNSYTGWPFYTVHKDIKIEFRSLVRGKDYQLLYCRLSQGWIEMSTSLKV